jgi:hypothetical protein
LREELINATHRLLVDKGAEGFSLTTLAAGGATAAPYKHFRDKRNSAGDRRARLLMLAERSPAVAAGGGHRDGIIAMGLPRFAVSERRCSMMFGQSPAVKEAPEVEACGRACFSEVITQVELACVRNQIPGDARQLALELWTFVHGAACLLIDRDYDKVARALMQWG